MGFKNSNYRIFLNKDQYNNLIQNGNMLKKERISNQEMKLLL